VLLLVEGVGFADVLGGPGGLLSRLNESRVVATATSRYDVAQRTVGNDGFCFFLLKQIILYTRYIFCINV